MIASKLQDLVIVALMRKSGGTQRRWRAVLGPIKVHDPRTHAHCNWSVAPSGTSREIGEVERLLDIIRLEHPIVSDR
ncbi:hypothetical protein [Sphingomonas tagetis]|nr:hypothetical protein [Sphingomonas tagetis]